MEFGDYKNERDGNMTGPTHNKIRKELLVNTCQ